MLRSAVLSFLVVAAVFAVVGCGESEPEAVSPTRESTVVEEATIGAEAAPTQPASGQPRFGGTLRIVSQASVTTLDPIFTNAYVPEAIAQHFYETPFGFDRDLNPKARMVDTWEASSDGKTYTFTLREGLRFHNGNLVTVEDAAVSLNRWLGGPGPSASFLRNFVVGEEAFVASEGGQSFQLLLKESFGAVLITLANSDIPAVVMPKELSSVPASQEVLDRTGSGVYKFVRWEQGDRVVLERFDGYVSRDEPPDHMAGGTTAYLDGLIWLEIPDEETKIAGLETGEWDVVDGAGLDFYVRTSSNPEVRVPVYKPGHRSNVILNPNIAPFGNAEAEAPPGERLTAQAIAGRQAVATGVNIESVEASLGPPDLWDLCDAIYYCGTPLESHAGTEYYNRNDKARAKQFLEESGYGGETIVLLNPTDYGTITPTGVVLQQELQAIGFDVDMPANDWATVVTTFTTKTDNWHALASWTVHWCCGNPITDEAAAGGTSFWPNIPRVQELRLAWAKATDAAEKSKYLDELQVLLYQQVEIVYLGIFYSIFPHTAALHDFEVRAIPFYANTWLER